MKDIADILDTPNRRSFLKKSMVAGAVTASAGILGSALSEASTQRRTPITPGDVAILRFLAAAELIETDLWQQYAELGGLTSGTQNNYQLALQQLDSDGSQYISSNTLDERSHADFLNAYLLLKGAQPVNLDQFRTLPSSQATGAKQIKRLTNLMQLTVDTSYYVRYRSKKNPDFGATFGQAVTIDGVTAIPRTNDDFTPPDHIQAIANTAAFHFGFIEQGGSSLYHTLALKVSNVEVLRIVLSIGADETHHFGEWMDFAGNAVSPPIAPLVDPTNGLTFPNLNLIKHPVNLQTNLIFPVPTEFINPDLPLAAVIRPTAIAGVAAGAVRAFTDDGLFIGQTPEFFDTLNALADAADAAQRGL
jgi:hypothetical protein